MKSKKVKSFVDNFAAVIADVLDTDVIIVDDDMDIIGKSLKYFSVYNDIKIGSLIAKVLSENEKIYVQDKSDIDSCRKCKEYKICKMRGFIGVPIKYENKIIGVLALILQKSKVKKLFEKLESALFFMENMADLIGIRINEINERKSLKNRMQKIESILNFTNEALVYTDQYANIIFFNKAFRKLFEKKDSILYRPGNLKEIYKDILSLYAENKKIENIKLSLEYNERLFYGRLSLEPVNLTIEDKGFICRFDEYENSEKKEKFYLSGSLVTFTWLAKYIKQEVLDEAKILAGKTGDILIHSKDNALNELLAKAIFNYSERRLEDIRVIYMQNIYRDLLDEFFISEYGILKMTQKGAFVIVQPEGMNLHIQDRFADFIKENDRAFKERVRLIFCTSENLYDLSENGLFSKKLYQYLSDISQIGIDNIDDEYELFDGFIKNAVKYYSGIYKNKGFSLSKNTITDLWEIKENYSLTELDTLIESMVRSNSSEYKKFVKKKSVMEMSVIEFEEKYLQKMIKQGKTQKEIYEIMGMSRSTLYRRLKKMEGKNTSYGKKQ